MNPAGYITRDLNDVKGINNDEYKGWAIQYNRPGLFGRLKDLVDMLK